jgi:hypothetical protein
VLTMRDVRRVARQVGATVEGGKIGRWCSYNVDAPRGQVWAASSTHALRVEWRADDKQDSQDALEDVLERMEEGLADCDPDCEICGDR